MTPDSLTWALLASSAFTAMRGLGLALAEATDNAIPIRYEEIVAGDGSRRITITTGPGKPLSGPIPPDWPATFWEPEQTIAPIK